MYKLRFFFSLLLLSLLLKPVSLHAMNGIIWQPHDKDLAISDMGWQTLMHKVRLEGFDTFVVQWTRHGDSFSTPERREELQKKIESAREAGLKIILGLYMDPEFFDRQKQPAMALSNYLNRLRALDITQVQIWQSALSVAPDGWYISAEIDDFNWRDKALRQLMLTWLQETKNQIKKHSVLPVYISSFFTGKMTPASYGALVAEMQAIGFRVWVQDGSGVNTLTANQRELYLSHIAASGIVYELFTIKPGEQFSASAKSDREIKRLLAHRSGSFEDRLYFSLRYLPISAGVLEIAGNEE